jgi:predicted DNA-binding protein
MIAWAKSTKTGEIMTTRTFETIAHDGVIDLPVEQYDLNGKAIKVIIMDDTSDYEAVLEDLQDIIAANAVLNRVNSGKEKTYSIAEMEARLNAMDG